MQAIWANKKQKQFTKAGGEDKSQNKFPKDVCKRYMTVLTKMPPPRQATRYIS